MDPKIASQWDPQEWGLMTERLKRLTLEELRQLTTDVGIEFSDGNETITDKEDFILVLDEADKNALQEAYQKILGNRP